VNGPFTQINTAAMSTDPSQFTAPLVMDPTSPGVLYAGTNHLWQSSDGGTSWQTLPLGQPAQDFSSNDNSPSNSISAIAVSRSDPGASYVATGADGNPFHSAKLWFGQQGGQYWTDRTASLPQTDHFITSLPVDPTASSTAYLTLSGFNTGHVWKTTDSGTTWTDVSDNLPDAPVNAIQIYPSLPNTIYIATDVGVYMSTTGGGQWADISLFNGIPSVVVDDVVLNRAGTELFAFTPGRGAYVADVAGAPGNPWAWGDNSSYQGVGVELLRRERPAAQPQRYHVADAGGRNQWSHRDRRGIVPDLRTEERWDGVGLGSQLQW
jgi:photosystem II stability/assembly factor-like uncharacterized protein